MLTCSRSFITPIARSIGKAYNDSRPFFEDRVCLRDPEEWLRGCDAPRTINCGTGGSEAEQTVQRSATNIGGGGKG